MNADRLEGFYRQMKGRALQAWGRMTGDQAMVLRGRAAALSGQAQSSFGRAMRGARLLGFRRRFGA